MAISNKHAAIKGTPEVTDEEQMLVAQALLAMRGASTKKHKEMHQKDELMLLQKPLSYKGASMTWHKRTAQKDDWVAKPKSEWGGDGQTWPLRTIICPECTYEHNVDSLDLKVKVALCNLTCKQCREVTSTRRWACACGALWYKCGIHRHRGAQPKTQGVKRKGCCNEGVTKPMPKGRRCESNVPCASSSTPANTVRLPAGSKLAARFPHLVKPG